MKFKQGDRVRYVNKNGRRYLGKTGTVTLVEYYLGKETIFVDWDKYQFDHEVNGHWMAESFEKVKYQ